MDNIFSMDSPFMRTLTRIADLFLLNIWTLLGCLPIFTIGASMTAMHYVLLKMARGEEGYISKSYFKSFKENFKQGTAIFMIFFVIFAVMIGDILVVFYSNAVFPDILGLDFPTFMGIVLSIVGMLCLMVWLYVFPALSHFENNVRTTIKNAFMFSIIALPFTVLMILIYVAFFALIYFVPYLIPMALLFGFSGPGYLCAFLYSKTFKRFEPEEDLSESEWGE